MSRLAELLGESRGILELCEKIRQLLARSQGSRRLPPILLQGETGTGKGLVANLIHKGGPRRAGPFVEVNCAAIPGTLLEAELFGFEKGAFTDATRAKAGLFQTADGGTIFLDEVGLLPETLQSKLLKVIEERAVRRLGSTLSEPTDVQVISATNEDLATAVRGRRFREDLYHRLAVVTLSLPPLRDRGEDIVLLAEHFLSRWCADYDLPPKELSADARSALVEYRWPGNVRELGNVMERVTLLAEASPITASILGLSRIPPPARGESAAAEETALFDDRLARIEREQLLEALRETNWNITQAARRLGITRGRLRYRITKQGLRPEGSVAGTPPGAERPAEPPTVVSTPGAPETAPGSSVRWERRYLAFLRAELQTRSSPESLLLVGRTLAVSAEKIQSFGGQIQEVSPTTIVAAFGLDPIENAPTCAALAAMAIEKAAERARGTDPTAPTVKIAVDAGQSMVGQVHGALRIDLGDKERALTTLAALANLPEPEGIVVSEAAAPFLEPRFELVRVSRGEGDLGHSYRLTRRERTGFGLGGRALSVFVGREREFEVLRERLEEVERGQGRVVALVGEPGVGKSRFVYELTRSDRVRDWRILRCGAVSYGMATPSLPVIDLIKRYFLIDDAEGPSGIRQRVTRKVLREDRLLEPYLPALFALLGAPVDDPQWHFLDPSQRRQRTLDAVKRLVLRESQTQPLLLIVEDLHWIDTETQALLDSVVESLPSARVLLVVTYRPDYRHGWGGKSYYDQVRLHTLSPESAARLLGALLGADAALEPLKTTLIARTGGNPFFLEESIRTLVETKALVGERAAYRLTETPNPIQVPATVQAVLAARIDRLPLAEKDLLQAAAVVGKDVPLVLLQAVADLPEDVLRRGLTRLQAAEFLYETSSLPEIVYTINHALTHEVAYASLADDRRRALHARIVDEIEALYPDRLTQHIERLGHHAFRGEVWEKAVQCLRQAGAKAVDRSANREAVAFFEQALAALRHLPERGVWVEEAIDLRFHLRSPLTALGEFGRLRDYLLEAERLSETLGGQRRLGQVSAYLTQLYILTGDHDRVIRSGQRALDLAEAIGELSVRVVANNCLGDTYFSLGDYPRSMEFHGRNTKLLQGELMRERFDLAGLPSVLSRTWLAWSLAELGRFAEGIAWGEDAARIAAAVDHPYSQIFADFGIGGLYLRKGDFGRALPPLEHGLTLCQATGSRILFPYMAGLLGSVYAFSERLSDAVPLLEQAVQTSISLNVMVGRSLLVGFLSEAYLRAGRPEDAGELAQRALDLSRAHQERGWEAWTLKLLGDVARQGRPDEVDHAIASYRQALALASELGMRPLVAHCHFGLGSLHRRRGNRAEAGELLRTAIAMFHGMDMPFWLEQAEAQLGEFAAPDPKTRAGRRTEGAHRALTTGSAPPALLIVSMERVDLYDYFRRRFEVEATGHVILDRRSGERRRASKGHEPERRHADRRLRPGVDPELRSLGFAIVSGPGPREGSDAGALGQPP